MSEHRHLKKPPITEALLDFRVRSVSADAADAIAKLRLVLAQKLPVVDEQQSVRAEFEIGAQGPVAKESRNLGVQGAFFRSADEHTIAQFRKDGFTYNRLQPYSGWNTVFPEALSLWHEYIRAFQPSEITRLAVRYINRVAIPLPVSRIDEYLCAAPAIPSAAPQHVSSFVSRVVVDDIATSSQAAITQIMEPIVDSSHAYIILDIDVFAAIQLEPYDRRVSELLISFRSIKNKIFFTALTDKALETYS
jgi:uncharacterized protein (TIGR04255 family)